MVDTYPGSLGGGGGGGGGVGGGESNMVSLWLTSNMVS